MTVPNVSIFGNKGNTSERIIVGEIRNNETYFTWREKTSIYRAYDGFTISVDVLSQLCDKNVNRIEFMYRDEMNVILYKISLAKFLLYGQRLKDQFEDRYVCSRSFMEAIEPKF